jgi:hypothetical protein
MRRLSFGLVLVLGLLMLIAVSNCNCKDLIPDGSKNEHEKDHHRNNTDRYWECFKRAKILPEECTESCTSMLGCFPSGIPDWPELPLPQTMEECQTICENGSLLGNTLCSECVFTCWLNAPVCNDALRCALTCADSVCQPPDDDTADDDTADDDTTDDDTDDDDDDTWEGC